jgi:hypothetical protein
LAGIAITSLLFYSIWLQIRSQLPTVGTEFWRQGETRYLVVALLLMPLNVSLEVFKWKFLAGAAQPMSQLQAWKSYLAGIALSLITPNRIGEYPGRILYLKRKNTIRLVSVSILGAFAQFIALFAFGIVGLIYYNVAFPGTWQKLVLAAACITLLLLTLLFFRFEQGAAYLEHRKWLNRFATYRHIIRRFSAREQLVVLALSMLRFLVYTFQFLLLLKWMHIDLLSLPGLMMALLYFWAVAVIPSIAFAELGIRGQVSLFLFQHFTGNTIGILSAALGLWCINLIVPAIIGSILLVRVKLLR